MNVTREEFPIEITDIAVEKALNERKNSGEHLRVALQGGGCEIDGLTVIIDGHSANLLAGATLDYTVTLMASGFKFINPEAKRQCGCGSSFSY